MSDTARRAGTSVKEAAKPTDASTASNPEAAQTADANGEVSFIKPSGKVKVRSGQTEEQFQEQLKMYSASGPTIRCDDSAVNLGTLSLDTERLDLMEKIDREHTYQALERLYYEGKFQQCLQRCQNYHDQIPHDIDLQLKKNKRSKLVLDWLDGTMSRCKARIERASH